MRDDESAEPERSRRSLTEMKCPFCRDLENKVIDSRLSKDGDIIRRRRECLRCERRFTTYERVEEMLPMIVKKDGRREVYERLKVIAGLKKACEKRPVSMERIEQTADRHRAHAAGTRREGSRRAR